MTSLRHIVLIALAGIVPSFASAQQITGLYLPKIAVAPDGSFAVAAEALVNYEVGGEVLEVLVQRYAADGSEVGPAHRFGGESCSGLDIWLSDYMERPEIAFQPNGTLVVLMQHSGEFQLAGDGITSSEMTLAAIDVNGQVIDLNNSTSCVQQKLIFPGGSRQDRPRMALTPDGSIIVTGDGFFDDADLRNVAIRVLAADGSELIDQAIPHDDPASEVSFHMHPDVATNGQIVLATWLECPIIDNQGNFETCDIGAQFASVTAQGLAPMGGNVVVNAGDPPGTLQLYPSADMNASGESVVVWADARDGAHGEIYAQRFGADGARIGGNVRASEGQGIVSDDRPEVAILEDGRFMVVWADSAGGRYTARARSFDASGAPIGASVELAPGSLQSGQPSIVADGSDFAYLYLSAGESGIPEIGSNIASLTDVDRPGLPDEAGIRELSLYPNPFRESSRVTWESGGPGHVSVRVFDVMGREVARPVDEFRASGSHAVDISGVDLAPGVYFVEVRQGDFRSVGKVVRVE